MARIRRVTYFVAHVPHRAGEAARLLEQLRGVNLLMFTGFPDGRRAQVDFVPANAAAFKRAAARAKLRVRAKQGGFLVQGADRPGALAAVMRRLAQAGINVTAVDAVSAGGGRFGAILWVKPKDAARAAKVLRAK